MIPIELFMFMIGLSLVMGIIGLIKKIPLGLFIGGAFITFMAIITDGLLLGQIPDTSTVSGLTTSYEFTPNEYTFTAWDKILISSMGSIILVTGALIWKQEEN